MNMFIPRSRYARKNFLCAEITCQTYTGAPASPVSTMARAVQASALVLRALLRAAPVAVAA